MARHSLVVDVLIVTMIVLYVPFSTASSEARDGWLQVHKQGGSGKVSAGETSALGADDDTEQNVQPDGNTIKDEDPDMLQPFFANHQLSSPRNGSNESSISRDPYFNGSAISTRRAQSTGANLISDKTTYYDGQKIQVTFEVNAPTTTELPFVFPGLLCSLRTPLTTQCCKLGIIQPQCMEPRQAASIS
ncbi:hypothetical protein MHU86_23088 [Fragilaria crotonensis]|nr:hypothetical protein MHU86_23088 [Fragilaria crotonensis]